MADIKQAAKWIHSDELSVNSRIYRAALIKEGELRALRMGQSLFWENPEDAEVTSTCHGGAHFAGCYVGDKLLGSGAGTRRLPER